VATLVGGALAALAGLAVGLSRRCACPSAIVTLGFGEIIRVLILNIDAVAERGLSGVLNYTNFFWSACGLDRDRGVLSPARLDARRAMLAIREEMPPRRWHPDDALQGHRVRRFRVLRGVAGRCSRTTCRIQSVDVHVPQVDPAITMTCSAAWDRSRGGDRGRRAHDPPRAARVKEHRMVIYALLLIVLDHAPAGPARNR
jgi:hypothetical protein